MSNDPKPFTFTSAQERTLASVLNEIIPPSSDGKMPGAGDVGLAAQIQETVRQRPDLGPVLSRGLDQLEALAHSRGAADYAALARDARIDLLKKVAAVEDGFLTGILFPTYVAYYQNARVLEGLGREPRPPFPQGYEVPPFDLTLVEPVRRRARMYRTV